MKNISFITYKNNFYKNNHQYAVTLFSLLVIELLITNSKKVKKINTC